MCVCVCERERERESHLHHTEAEQENVSELSVVMNFLRKSEKKGKKVKEMQ